MKRWFMRLFGRPHPPDRQPATTPRRDPEVAAAQQAYQDDKMAAAIKLVETTEMLARLKRMGYELDVTTRRQEDAPDRQH